MKRVIHVLLLIALAASASSYADNLTSVLSERSKQIESLKGRFEQYKTIAVLPAPLHSTGQFEYTLGKAVIWKMLEPVQQTIELGVDGIRFDGAAKKNPQPGIETVSRIFMSVISGELSSLSEYFSIDAQGEPDHWVLVLKPISSNLAAYIQLIEIRGGELTEQLDIAETNGDKTQIRFIIDNVTRIAH